MFPVQRVVTPTLPKLNIITPRVGEEDVIQPIQGILPDSLPEYWISRALERLRHRFIFQYEIFGVRGVRGSYKIDWLILSTVPLATPLEYFGEYWHSGEMGAEDQFRINQINDYFQGSAFPVEIIWGNETKTEEDANAVLLRKIGRA